MMIDEQEINTRLKCEKEAMDKLLHKCLNEKDEFMKNSYLGIRSKVYERVIALEWVLGIRKSIDD